MSNRARKRSQHQNGPGRTSSRRIAAAAAAVAAPAEETITVPPPAAACGTRLSTDLDGIACWSTGRREGREGEKVHHYDPARALACQVMNVPYGAVYVNGLPNTIHSCEVILDSRDRSAFIPPDVAAEDRAERRRLKAQADQEKAGRRADQERRRAERAAGRADRAARSTAVSAVSAVSAN